MSLDVRQHDAVNVSERLVHVADGLVRRSLFLRNESLRLRARAAAERGRGSVLCGRAITDDSWFTVRGVVDGIPMIARWAPGMLDCDAEVQRRASVVVSLGETFSDPQVGTRVIDASLAGPPIAVLLTVMRAFSSVNAVDLSIDMLTTPAV